MKEIEKVYAFDVDETLEVSAGPIKIQSLVELYEEGHCVGICGNWAQLIRSAVGWNTVISFLGPITWIPEGIDIKVKNTEGKEQIISITKQDIAQSFPLKYMKAHFLSQIKLYTPAKEFIMVGNILGVSGQSDDKTAAELAGWRFIQEIKFAEGER